MAHFANIDKNNVVTKVIVAEQAFIDSGVLTGTWVQTSYNANAVAGSANTGGGGGGEGPGGFNSGAGGSGIVVIAYATDGSTGVSTSSTGGTLTTSGGETIHTFSSSGTWTMVASAAVANGTFYFFF